MLLLLCGLVFQSSIPLHDAFLWCCCYFVVLFFNRLSLCTMPSYDVGFWVCECVIKCVRPYMHPCSMPRPWGSDTGSCTNAAATVWVWFFNVFPFARCLLMMLVCECVSVCVHTCIHVPCQDHEVQIQVLAQMLLLLYGSGFSIVFPFARCLLMMLVCECVSV